MSIRVLLADDQPLLRTGFRMILEAEPDIEVSARRAMASRRCAWRAASGRTWC